MLTKSVLTKAVLTKSELTKSELTKSEIFRALLVIFLLVAVLPSIATAGELKIVDARGLIRALKEVRDSSTVIVTIESKPSDPTVKTLPTIVLSNVNGLAGDISGQPVSNQSMRFENVPHGEWRIQSATGPLEVRSVEIR
jgi:hypothetical protein